jgi:phosphinothricin acetyltransferase
MQEGTLDHHPKVSPAIRRATREDAAAVREIYRPAIEGSAASFEVEVPTVSDVEERIASALQGYEWLVAESGGEVIGYAYAGQFRARAAYAPSAEVSVYLAENARGKGVGRALLSELIKRLQETGFANALAGVTLPNPASVRLFESMGFKQVGVFRRVGYKFDAWHDVGWWQLELEPPQDK